MGLFEKGLSIWVIIAMLIGVTLGKFFPLVFLFLADIELARVNLIVAILIWAMIYPMMLKIDFTCLTLVSSKPKGLFLTSFV